MSAEHSGNVPLAAAAAAVDAAVGSKKRKLDSDAAAEHSAVDADDAAEDQSSAEESAKKARTESGAAAAESADADADAEWIPHTPDEPPPPDDDEEETAEDEDEMDARPAFGGGFRSASSAAAAGASSAAAAPSFSSAPFSSALGARLLALAGYKGSGGLGKHGTGIVEPVKSSAQVAKEGIGFEAPVKRREHEFEAFEVEIELKPIWITQEQSSAAPLPSLETMLSSWMQLGPRDPSVLSDPRYCSLDVQDALLAAKSAFDGIPSIVFRQARERSNPFERIRSEFFQNRAALKMVEMDAMCGRIFTQPPSTRNILGQPPRKREIIQIGDVCAGPGGFSEFMLTVLKWRCSIHGFTLRGNNDFNVSKFNRNASPTSAFHAWYGKDNTGDITSNENMRDYCDKVNQHTKGKGLHVLMADGGFSVVGRENMQEYLSRQLVLCQCLMALANLREGGVFVCKLFDSFLPFTVELLWIVRKCFSHFALIKPNQSRPANSERYVVAHGFLQRSPPVVEYLFAVNARINELKKTYKFDALTAVDFNANRNNATRDRDRAIRDMAAATAAAANAASAMKFEPSSDGPLIHDGSSAPAGVKVEDEPAATGATDEEAPAVVKSELDSSAADASSSTAAASSSPAAAAVPSEPEERDILHLVPQSVLDADPAFVEYVRARNESYAARQIFTLRRLKQYVEDSNLRPDDQEKVREDCLAFWSLSQQPPPQMPPIEDLRPLAERIQRRVLQRTLQEQRAAAVAASSNGGSSKQSDSPRAGRSKQRNGDNKSKRKKKRKPKVVIDSDASGNSDSDGSAGSHGRNDDSETDSPSSSSSRSSSRSRSPTSPKAAAAAASSSSSAVVAADVRRASDRSPSPPPSAPVKKLYVHYDPLWTTRHIDPAYPLNANLSFFWTNAHSRRMFERHIPDDMAASLQLLPLPNEQERARLRLFAEQNPSAPLDPRMVQLENLARYARSWHVFAIPSGGIRHTVYFNAQGMGHIDAQGKPNAWAMQPPLRVPPDTILDVVWSHGCMYVLDAWSLPSPADLFVYRTRPRLLDRFELVELLVESCADGRLKTVAPFPLLEWRSNGHIQEAVRKIATSDPVFDLFFLRDGPRAVPQPQTSYCWTPADEVTFKQVDQLITYVCSKQVPAPTAAAAAASKAPPHAARAPPVAVAAASAVARPR